MTISTFNYFALFTATFAIVGFLTPLVRRFAISKDIYDKPDSAHKTHKEPVPYLGGVAIMVGILLICYVTAIYKSFSKDNLLLMTSVLAPAFVLGLIGLWDDLKNLSPAPRFAIQTIAGIFTAWIMISNNTVGNPTGSKVLDAVITVVWIVGICNSINFFDNLDGGAAGTVAVTSLALFILGFQGKQYLIAALAAVTAGAMFGFLIWNKSPARIYMGDAGALFLGIMIATLTIRLKPNAETQWTSLATPVLMLAVPILDTSVAVFSRIRRGISPLQGGHDHLSHILVRMGLQRKIAAICLWALSGFFAFLALLIPIFRKTYEEILIICSAVLWLYIFIWFIKSDESTKI
jgi:UDP-GlcNAc:undecaprenyl-phosphate/decaprenyl-phosphate GlcNAc-1-phosphate transferase